jgi:transcriptional regulator with XRE-family HTH domain
MRELDICGLVRRARRRADLSQRELAARAGVSASAVARAESTGRVRLAALQQIFAATGLRLAVVDATSSSAIAPMRPDAVRDKARRRLPAHLDPAPLWWKHLIHPRQRYETMLLPRSMVRYLRIRSLRDLNRRTFGIPADHPGHEDRHPPRPRLRPSAYAPIDDLCTCGPECERRCIDGCECGCEYG